MKKYILVLITGITFSTIQAQEIRDAVRYSQDNLNGTARFRAMGGAFGALGGDMSSINVNPAGSANLANTQLAFTLTNTSTSNKANYFGDTKTLDVHVKRLRAKIEPDSANPRHLITVRGLGYKFEAN